MTRGRRRSVRQHATHAQLIGYQPGPVRPAETAALDAIVIPASRQARNLEHAIALAKTIGCQLVILCSREARTTEVNALLGARSFSKATVIEIPRGYSHPFFQFSTTDRIRRQVPNRDCDLSMKRNVGLVLARMLGWERIFFLDDDIRNLQAAALLKAASLLHRANSPQHPYYSVGMSASDFPDNSVVCHARRAIGEFQDVFVSGSALAVNCTVPFAFFPDTYNEDWLFFYRDAAAGRLGSSGHRVTQLRYDPFANPQRAANEEFGDVIAEGLYALLDRGLSAEDAITEQYWHQFMAARRELLDEITSHSSRAPRKLREKMNNALGTARGCLEEIQPAACVGYIAAWHDDLKQWEDRRDTLPSVGSISKALDELGLSAG